MARAETQSITIDAPPQDIYDVIIDMESYPEWAEGVQKAEVLDADEQGRPLRVRFTVDARVMEVTYVLVYEHDEPERLTWELEEGKQINQLDGRYSLTTRDGGTEVTYSLAVDVDLPLPGFMKKRAARVIMETGLKGLKRRVESG
ncbi:MAG: SRPBCC family protein [Nitriliruptorales bacterium]|nr:SRPBCC family protein [Nitriliruptorales bacterium]